jgi:NADH-quinone oxidoreductase subunit I
MKIVARPQRDLATRLYLPGIVKGMGITIRHFLKNLVHPSGMPTLQYPEQTKDMPAGYRGKHRLTKREDGSVRCVACFMCATACPADCIHIVAEDVGKQDVEKAPKSFDIDLLRCVFCGMCVEACPVDAIRMDSGQYTIADMNRKDFVITKEELMAIEPAMPRPSQQK